MFSWIEVGEAIAHSVQVRSGGVWIIISALVAHSLVVVVVAMEIKKKKKKKKKPDVYISKR